MKKVILGVVILLSLLTVTACSKIEEKNETISSEKRSEELKIIINKEEYQVELEDNETVTELLKIMPREMEMIELNGNEKYHYLEQSLPTNPTSPKQIEKGDIMLFGDNCLVIFYQSFKTNYSYTRIGHIHNLKDIGENNITVKFE